MNIIQLTERAFATWLGQQTLTVFSANAGSMYKGVENADGADVVDGESYRRLPCVTIIAEGPFNEAIAFTGDFRGDLVVRVEGNGNTLTDAQFDALADEIFSQFQIAGLAGAVSDVTANFCCLFANAHAHGTSVRNGTLWQSEMRIEVVVCGADLGSGPVAPP